MAFNELRFSEVLSACHLSHQIDTPHDGIGSLRTSLSVPRGAIAFTARV